MTNQPDLPGSFVRQASLTSLRAGPALALIIITTRSAQAQTLTVLHTFTGGWDGASPFAGLTMDQAGISTERPQVAASRRRHSFQAIE